MIKSMVLMVWCVVFGNILYAEGLSEAQGFVGAEIGAASVQADVVNEARHEGDSVEFGLRIGAQRDVWRTMLLFDYFDSTTDDQNIEKGYFLLDYFFLNDDYMQFRPFIGANLGYINYESSYIDISSFVYGVQAGVAFELTDNIDMDISYRFSLANEKRIDTIGSLTFGLNYLY